LAFDLTLWKNMLPGRGFFVLSQHLVIIPF